jgi:hypothetical protein
MTSKPQTVPRHLRARLASLALIAALLAGCASLPDDAAVVEQLDDQTGLTVLRLGRPVELYREGFHQDKAERFGFFGPFETNQMGKRELFLWVATPTEGDVAPAAPAISVDGTRLALGEAGRAADFAGLRKSPYKIPTPWIAAYYFRIDPEIVARLGAAGVISVDVVETTRNGEVAAQYTVQLAGDARLREFAARH